MSHVSHVRLSLDHLFNNFDHICHFFVFRMQKSYIIMHWSPFALFTYNIDLDTIVKYILK